MVSDIWLRTILIVRKETRCRHIGYSSSINSKGSFICTIPLVLILMLTFCSGTTTVSVYSSKLPLNSNYHFVLSPLIPCIKLFISPIASVLYPCNCHSVLHITKSIQAVYRMSLKYIEYVEYFTGVKIS